MHFPRTGGLSHSAVRDGPGQTPQAMGLRAKGRRGQTLGLSTPDSPKPSWGQGTIRHAHLCLIALDHAWVTSKTHCATSHWHWAWCSHFSLPTLSSAGKEFKRMAN